MLSFFATICLLYGLLLMTSYDEDVKFEGEMLAFVSFIVLVFELYTEGVV